jgi:hypothetical protein
LVSCLRRVWHLYCDRLSQNALTFVIHLDAEPALI